MLEGRQCRLRAHRLDDADALREIAGALDAARGWLEKAAHESPVDHFAIEVDGCLAGGAGIEPYSGERTGGAGFGYWLGRAFWNRGIASEAVELLALHAFSVRGVRRLEAHVFAPNVASARVLEKCQFRREAVLRQAYVERDGTIVDGLLYARLDRRR